MIISEKIFEILKERNITQKAFSEKTGISQSTISDWKRKRTNPTAEKIMVICEVLEISPEELLSGEGFGGDYTIIRKDSEGYLLWEKLQAMPQEDKERLKHYMEKL